MDLLIGGISGVLSRTCTAPLELYKIQEQNRFIPNTTLIDVIKKEGFHKLWKGNYSNCIRIFPQMAINYYIYNKSSTLFSPTFEKNRSINHLLSGCLSGCVSMISIYPLENIRTRLSLQTNNSHYNGIIDIIMKTKTRELYGGLGMSLLGYIPYNGLSFMFFSYYKSILERNNIENEYIPLKLLAGGLAGISAVSLTYPTDLIRRRLQLQGFDERVPKYNGIIDCCKKIYINEGIRGLYRGLIPCYLKIFPTSAIQFYVMTQLTCIYNTIKTNS